REVGRLPRRRGPPAQRQGGGVLIRRLRLRTGVAKPQAARPKRDLSMYIPGAFAVEDRAVLYDFLDRFGFATLVSVVDGAPFGPPLPMLLDREGGRLLGHVARANPHWHGFDGEREALVVFHGPHAYVSPSWYAAALAVPTWNYAAVHVYGRPRPVTDA